MKENSSHLYHLYAPSIHRRCVSLLKDEDAAWDATQEIFLKFLKYSETEPEENSRIPWILKVTQNHCFNILRERKKFDYNTDLSLLSEANTIENDIEISNYLNELFNVNDKRVRDAAYYTYVEELTQDEIQKVCGQSPATVRRNLARFKEWVIKTRNKWSTHERSSI